MSLLAQAAAFLLLHGSAAVAGQAVRGEPVEASAVEPATPAEPDPQPGRDHRVLSAVGLTGTYAALGTWMWVAWYKDQPRLPRLRVGGDGWLGEGTYAGGADKLGHLWANLALSRLGTDLLRRGGWGRWSSSLIASGACLAAFLLVEVNDGYHTEFSPGDMAANTLGALTAVAMSNWPALDDAIDLRVQWFPSAAFRRHPSADFAEDYSGQTYILAYKPRSLAAVRESDGALRWLQFVNPVIGLESRNYKPAPPPGDEASRRQRVFVGVTVDLQAVLDAALRDPSSAATAWIGGAGHRLFEYVNPPFSALPAFGLSRSTSPAAPAP